MNLSKLFAAILLRYKNKISIEEISNLLSSNSFYFLFILLALPSTIPVPAAGYSTPFGFAVLILAIQFLKNKTKPTLPNFIKKIQINISIIKKAFSPILFISAFLEKNFPHNNSNSHKLQVILVAILSIITSIPLPFTNTIPSIGVIILSIAMIHDNKTILHISSAIAVFIITSYISIFYAAYAIGSSLIVKLFS